MPRGGKREGAGRPKGSPNKLHAAAKETVKAFVESRGPQIGELWDKVAAVDEAKAIALWGQIAQYVLPKCTEISGDQDKPVRVKFGLD